MNSGVARMARKVWTHPANEGRRWRQLAQAIRFQVRGRLLNQPTEVPIGDRSRMSASLDHSSSILAAYARQPDYAEWEAWKRLLRPGDLFVDVGANVGTYTLLANEVGAQTISVEPVSKNLARLNENLALNGYTSEISQCALCAETTTLRFSGNLDGTMNHIAGDGAVEVRGETFDDLIGDRHVRGVKVDVEGAERQVLEGAQCALSEGRVDVWQLEWNETARANYGESRDYVAVLLREHDYQLFRPGGDGRLHPSDSSEGTDVFAVHSSAAAEMA